MKHIIVVVALVMALTLPLSAVPSAQGRPLQRKVTLQFVSIDAFVVLAQLASDVGLVLIHEHTDPTPRVTVDASDQVAVDVVEQVMRKTGLVYRVSGRALLVGGSRWMQQYLDITPLTVAFSRTRPEDAVAIVQGVFPYVEAAVNGSSVCFRVPRSFLPRVEDITTRLERAPSP